ncbi:hypothetical protein TNCV_1314391, partial [Trichonephila clavipes]
LLKDANQHLQGHVWFQQDGFPAHYPWPVREGLNLNTRERGYHFLKSAQTTLILTKSATGVTSFVTVINSTAMKDHVNENIMTEFAVTVPNDVMEGMNRGVF